MAYFVYSISLEPLPESSNFTEFSAAESNIWVKAESLDEARVIATAAVVASGWKVQQVQFEMQATLERHPWNQKDTQPDGVYKLGLERSYNELLQTGLGIEIFAVRRIPAAHTDLHIRLGDK